MRHKDMSKPFQTRKNYFLTEDQAKLGKKQLAQNYAILRDPYYSDSVQRWVVEYAEEKE